MATNSDYIFYLGLFMYWTIPVMMLIDGVRSEEDVIRWIMDKPLHFIEMVPVTQKGGLALQFMALMLYCAGH